MRTYRDWSPAAALMLAVAFASSAHADDVTRKRVVGADLVQLQLLAVQPFFSEKDVAAKHITEGLQIEGGATPVMPDAASNPNHQLAVQVLDRDTGQVVSDARVTMKFGPIDDKGRPTGAQIEVPVVVTQAIGQGPTSTRYGNNVTMPEGRYQVYVTVNDEPGLFAITAN
jgi:hypothetical protein